MFYMYERVTDISATVIFLLFEWLKPIQGWIASESILSQFRDDTIHKLLLNWFRLAG